MIQTARFGDNGWFADDAVVCQVPRRLPQVPYWRYWIVVWWCGRWLGRYIRHRLNVAYNVLLVMPWLGYVLKCFAVHFWAKSQRYSIYLRCLCPHYHVRHVLTFPTECKVRAVNQRVFKEHIVVCEAKRESNCTSRCSGELRSELALVFEGFKRSPIDTVHQPSRSDYLTRFSADSDWKFRQQAERTTAGFSLSPFPSDCPPDYICVPGEHWSAWWSRSRTWRRFSSCMILVPVRRRKVPTSQSVSYADITLSACAKSRQLISQQQQQQHCWRRWLRRHSVRSTRCSPFIHRYRCRPSADSRRKVIVACVIQKAKRRLMSQFVTHLADSSFEVATRSALEAEAEDITTGKNGYQKKIRMR